jgi:hypothetical protein
MNLDRNMPSPKYRSSTKAAWRTMAKFKYNLTIYLVDMCTCTLIPVLGFESSVRGTGIAQLRDKNLEFEPTWLCTVHQLDWWCQEKVQPISALVIRWSIHLTITSLDGTHNSSLLKQWTLLTSQHELLHYLAVRCGSRTTSNCTFLPMQAAF